MDKTVSHFLIGAAFVVIIGWLGWQEVKAQGADWLPVKYVRIEGAFQYIAKDKIKQVLRGRVNKGLYNADIQQIQKSVKHLPWVESVKVKRVWPDAIDIRIVEQTPVVRWRSEGLLNKVGEIFIPDNIKQFNHLPLLVGPVGYEKKLLEIMKGVATVLSDQEMELIEFRINERRAWNMKLQNGLELILGRNEPLNKFQIFLKTFALLGKEQVEKVGIVDLRYPNGYALTWKQGEDEIDWKKIAKIKKYKVY
ncbi:MAG: FtsQ-type POTRA domain-containing protein [Methylococcales bacterium]|nr:FtsQ-type POTRA domain-containing protein [Methylococcales bacterium]